MQLAALVTPLSLFFFGLYDFECNFDDYEPYSIVWWIMHACLLAFFYFFLQPWVRLFSRPILNEKPSRMVYYEWYASWLLAAIAYHLPISRPVGVSMMMNPSLLLTAFASSALLLLVFRSICDGIRNICTNLKLILKQSVVVSVACCFSMRHCKEKNGNVKLVSWLPADDHLHVYCLWTGVVGITYIVIYMAKRRNKKSTEKPGFLDMVPWYSGISADLYETAFNLLVSVAVFLGRFDMRMLQATTNCFQNGTQEEGFLYKEYSKYEELWFDFMADTGDGGNSTYTVARLLAQRSIKSEHGKLPRGDFLLIGGDIAYPNPSQIIYEKRLFLPFNYAFQPPKDHAIDSNQAPQCFIIPGNHDWFDGLHTFMKKICDNEWLGGWFLPQKKSYFALKLPHRWWVFGLDLALLGDLDAYQFKFFSELAKTEVGEEDSVIVMTHQPDWLLNWYENCDPKNNVSDLISNILKERCKLRIAGDIHHFMRHSIAEFETNKKPGCVQHLLVNGCGGAYVHPTHVFRDFSKSREVFYECKAKYPSFKTSSKLAFRNIWNFRKENWQFDFVGGVIYFILVVSMFPQCELNHIFQVDIPDVWKIFFGEVWNAFIYMLEHSYVSLGGAMLLLTMAIALVPSKVSWTTRVMIGILHVSAHLAAALILMLVLELGVEALVHHKTLATAGYPSLYQRYQSLESNYFLSNGTRARVEQWTFGIYPACIKYLLTAFDVPELMAVTRSNVCKNGMESISRGWAVIYYASVFLYFWILSTPLVSFVFGSYLYICINWLNLHYNEGFSSLRIADYKAFTRFHIKRNGDLEVFTLAVDKVPEDWILDEKFEKEQEDENKLSHERAFPSKWKAAYADEDPINTVRIIDKFVIKQKEDDQSDKKEKEKEDDQKHDISSVGSTTGED